MPVICPDPIAESGNSDTMFQSTIATSNEAGDYTNIAPIFSNVIQQNQNRQVQSGTETPSRGLDVAMNVDDELHNASGNKSNSNNSNVEMRSAASVTKEPNKKTEQGQPIPPKK